MEALAATMRFAVQLQSFNPARISSPNMMMAISRCPAVWDLNSSRATSEEPHEMMCTMVRARMKRFKS